MALTLAGALKHCAIHVLHGTTDTTVPVSSSKEFYKELQAARVLATPHIYDDVDHMDILLAFMSRANGGTLSSNTVRSDVHQLLTSLL